MSAVPEDVRALVREQLALSFKRMGLDECAEDFRSGRMDNTSSVLDAARCVMADRAARPSVPPVPDALRIAAEDAIDLMLEQTVQDTDDCSLSSTHREAAYGATGWLLFRGAMLPAERQRLRAETGEAKHPYEGNYVTNVDRYPG